jgi:high affinity Mn2+ porin
LIWARSVLHAGSIDFSTHFFRFMVHLLRVQNAFLVLPLVLAALAPAARGQTASDPAPAPATDWTFHAQSTIIEQGHASFPAEYTGPESLDNAAESARTFSLSLFLGRRLWSGAEVFYNPECFQGYGLSHTFGAAAFPNGEAVKSGFANLHYNTSRLFVRQVIGLGGEKEKIEEGPDQFADEVDVNRLVISVGKFSANDFFDDNAYSHDSRTQFLNWALWESAAWDYPADIVGFTGGMVVEWNTSHGTLHYGLFMEPTEANGLRLDHHLSQAFGQILQYDFRYSLDGERNGTVRPFVYGNRAHMGLYSEADAETNPDITTTRAYRWKEGAGISWDQSLSANLGAFVRLSCDDGKTESFAFDEVDRSAAAGLSLKGTAWHRAEDVVGLAGVVDGLAPDHRLYLAEGGTGLILGDGALHYGPEQAVEAYYSVRVGKWLTLSPDWQYLERPGYNRDRGGVAIYAVRAHLEY